LCFIFCLRNMYFGIIKISIPPADERDQPGFFALKSIVPGQRQATQN
jgi:hypothetical protein